jgi:hypothetical protein
MMHAAPHAQVSGCSDDRTTDALHTSLLQTTAVLPADECSCTPQLARRFDFPLREILQQLALLRASE